MSNLVDQIHRDHINMVRVIELIEQEVERARKEETPDLDLLEDALRYLTNYSDLVHHPKEDAMFERLAHKEPDMASQMDVLKDEHQSLARVGAAFLEIVKAAESGEFVQRKEVVKRGTEYMGMLRSHMDAEEVGILKRARAVLSDQDVADIEARYSDKRDPMMDDSLKKEYAALYRSLFE